MHADLQVSRSRRRLVDFEVLTASLLTLRRACLKVMAAVGGLKVAGLVRYEGLGMDTVGGLKVAGRVRGLLGVNTGGLGTAKPSGFFGFAVVAVRVPGCLRGVLMMSAALRARLACWRARPGSAIVAPSRGRDAAPDGALALVMPTVSMLPAGTIAG